MLDNNTVKIEYILKEVDALRSQIDHVTKEILFLERWSLISSGVIWSWLATTSNKTLPGLIYWAPTIITTLLCLRAWGLHLSNMQAARYIAKIEEHFELPSDFGWERLLSKARPPLVIGAAVLFWLILIMINIIIPLFYVSTIKP
jgi:hypothetical protein